MSVSVVVVAAGSGLRLGFDQPKALVELAGRSLVAHTVVGLAAAGLPPPVVVHPPAARDAFSRALAHLEVAALVEGSETRTGSVRSGVAGLGGAGRIVVIHDAARPLTPPAVIRAAVAAVTGDVVAAAPALPVADTLKRVAGPTVRATIDRTNLVGVQTPQVFRREVADAALALGDDATDELGLVERLIETGAVTGRIVVVPGSHLAAKLTYEQDLAFLTALVGLQ